MKKFFKKFSSILACSVLSFTLCFTSVGASYYQAMPVAVPAVWSLIETLFLSFGITFITLDSVTKDDDMLVDGVLESVQAWEDAMESAEAKARAQELKDFFANIADYWTGVALSIPDTIWNTLKDFISSEVVATQIYKPIAGSDINLYGCTSGQLADYIASLVGFSSSDSYIIKYVNGIYDTFVSCGYTGVFAPFDFGNGLVALNFFPIYQSYTIGFQEYSSTQTNVSILRYVPAYQVKCTYSLNYYPNSYTYSAGYNSAMNFYIMFDDSTIFFVNGEIYNLNQLCSMPINSTTNPDWGTKVSISDFGIPTREIYTGVEAQTLDMVTDIYANDGYDVITDGRTWDDEENAVVGGVTIPFPGNDLLEKYYNGEITWQELMDAIGVTVVDTTVGETIDGKPIEEEISETTTSILDVLLDLPATLLEGIASLFIPDAEFLDSKMKQINDKLGMFGIAPYDMSGIFQGGDDNPFKNITIELNGQTVTIVSFDYLPQFLDKFRPVIRGLMVLFMIYYSVNQLLQLFGMAGLLQGGNMSLLHPREQPSLDIGMHQDKIGMKGGR